MKGTEEQFDLIIRELAKNTKQFETNAIKHMTFVDRSENIFTSYGWSKKEVFKEIAIRLGHREPDPIVPVVKIAKKRAIRKKKVPDAE